MEKGAVYLYKSNEKTFPVVFVGKQEEINYGFKIGTYNPSFKKGEENLILFDDFRDKSVKKIVLYKRVLKLDSSKVIKKIGSLDEGLIKESISSFNDYQKKYKLHEELHELKKKVKYAQFNNERYTHLEVRIAKILRELGYSNSGKGKNLAHSMATRDKNYKKKHVGLKNRYYSSRH